MNRRGAKEVDRAEGVDGVTGGFLPCKIHHPKGSMGCGDGQTGFRYLSDFRSDKKRLGMSGFPRRGTGCGQEGSETRRSM